MRIGYGYDAHRLAEGRRLVIGGVEIPNEYGLLGHSDADVLVHAIIDALLGAIAKGDIGCLFPDSDPAYKDISSLKLLAEVSRIMVKEEYTVVNIDSTVVAQSPKLQPYIMQMREAVSEALDIPVSKVSIKAKTEEGMGFTGAKEGIAATAVCLVNKF